MIKKLYLPLLMALVVALSSCSNKMGALSSDYFTTTPQVLEAVGGKVPVTINGKFPEKYFKKNAVVEVTPVLKWEGGQVKGQPAVFQGEKVEGNDQTISYKMGGNYTMKTTFDYVPEMAKSELYLEFNAKVGKKTIAIPAVKIADGVISTSELINNTLSSANPALGDDAFQRIIKEAHNANIMFLIQQANIRSSELKTAKEFNKEVANVNDAENKKISNIEISAYASPDGGVKLNTGLAENREGNTTKLINKDLKKAKSRPRTKNNGTKDQTLARMNAPITRPEGFHDGSPPVVHAIGSRTKPQPEESACYSPIRISRILMAAVAIGVPGPKMAAAPSR